MCPYSLAMFVTSVIVRLTQIFRARQSPPEYEAITGEVPIVDEEKAAFVNEQDLPPKYEDDDEPRK